MKFKKKTLSNGLRVISIPEKDALAPTVLVLVEAGSKYEKKSINGLSHFLEHMCFKGTAKRPKALDISAEFDALGAQYNAFTSQEYTGYYAKVEPRHFKKAVDIVADLYLNPVFDANEIEKEKGVIIEEINMYEDLPHRRVGELLMSLMYGDQPAGWGIAGEKEVIRILNRENFIDYRNKHYVAKGTIVVVAGKFDEKVIMSEIQKSFSAIPKTAKHTKIKTKKGEVGPRVHVQHKQSDQTHIAIGLNSEAVSSKNYYTAEVLASVLGGGMSSRLFQVVREELGAAYYVRAGVDAYTDHGIFGVSAGIHHEKIRIVIQAIMDELKKLSSTLVEEKELARVKDYLVGNLMLSLEKSDEIANYFGGQEVLGQELKSPLEIAKLIRAVTPKAIRDLAKKTFKTENLHLAIIGPFKEKEEFVKLLSL
ncbi:MAG: pitrilysin family protein [Patescibacteria group bacterium]